MSKLLEVAAQALNVPQGKLTFETKREEVRQWDSMGHLILVAAVEEKFGVCIPMEDVNKIIFLKDFNRYIRTEEKK